MPIVRGDFAAQLAPGLIWSTFNRYKEKPEQYRRYNNVQNSSKAYEEDAGLAGLGPLAPKAELEGAVFDKPIQLGLVRYIHETFALAVAYSKEMRDDEQYGLMTQLAGQLGKSARFTSELYGHDVWNNAFVTTKYAGRDTLALCATNHPIVGLGTTRGNRPAVDVDLSHAALEAGIQNFMTQIDDRGLPIDLVPKFLLISPENAHNAERLLQSEFQPGTNNNDINTLRAAGITPVVGNYFTDSDAWFLIAPPSEIDVRFYWREMADTKTWDDDNADATFHKIRQRHSVGFGDWRGVYGSTGA